jgi:glycosyltransferase involved in cell wall biosynthesis
MSASDPLVSVTLITYNHARYIGPAIRSVLEQTHRDLEVVVVNDGSTDGTAAVIDGISDPRLRAFHQANQGPSAAANRALAACRGRYFAMMSGDDLLPPQRIERQLAEYVMGGTRALFSQMEFIDDDGAPAATDYYQKNLTPAHGRAAVLRRLFDSSPPAFILTLFTETRVLREGKQYCMPALYQLQDYDLLIRLAKKYDFAYLNEPLYRFRVRRGHVNLSGPDPYKLIRTRNEFFLLMRDFFDDIPADLFKEMFCDRLRHPGFTSPLEYQCEQAFVWLRAGTGPLRLLGVQKLYDLLQDDEGRDVLARAYGFTHVTFSRTIKSIDVDRIFPDQSLLYLDTGAGFNAAECVQAPADLGAEEFTLTFDLTGQKRVGALRWDPLEGAASEVRLESVTVRDTCGAVGAIDTSRVTSNGEARAEGVHRFRTNDPMFFLPAEGEIAEVTVRGRWRSPISAREFELEDLLERSRREIAALAARDVTPPGRLRWVRTALDRLLRRPQGTARV